MHKYEKPSHFKLSIGSVFKTQYYTMKRDIKIHCLLVLCSITFVIASFDYDLSTWTDIVQFSSGWTILAGSYNRDAENNDCIYITNGNGDFYCFSKSNESLNILASSQKSLSNIATQNTVFFTANETASNDMLYFLTGNNNNVTIISFDITTKTTTIVSNLSHIIGSNPCVVRVHHVYLQTIYLSLDQML